MFGVQKFLDDANSLERFRVANPGKGLIEVENKGEKMTLALYGYNAPANRGLDLKRVRFQFIMNILDYNFF